MLADDSSAMEGSPEKVVMLDRLMNSVDRLRFERDALRDERNNLQRDFDFLKVETKFALESMQRKLLDATSSSSSTPLTPSPSSTHALQRAFSVSILVAQHLQSQHQHDSTQLERVAMALTNSQEQLAESQRRWQERDASIEKIQREDRAMRDALTTCEIKLATAEGRVTDLMTLARRLEEEAELGKAAHEEQGASFTQMEARLADVTKALEDAESQRASLALQVSHLQQDLDTAKAELLDSEARYSTLQAQQLASLSSSAQTRALKGQIEELEARVMRRTEQIGIHQHDIRRLETNLRLQEERVVEMTAELEVAEAEKKAMVEDCSNTREERDAALKKCEQLEEDIEMTEGNRNVEVQTLIGVFAHAVSDKRAAERQLVQLRVEGASIAQQLAESVTSREELAQEAANLKEEHASTLSTLRQTTSQLHISEGVLGTVSDEAKQATVALAILYHDLQGTEHAIHDAEDSRLVFQEQFQAVRADLQAKLGELSTLRAQYDALRMRGAEFESAQGLQQAHVQELEDRCHGLERAEADVREKYEQALRGLDSAKADLHTHTTSAAEQQQLVEETKKHLEETEGRFNAEVTELRGQLFKATRDLEEARVLHASAESEHRQALESADNTRKELQESLDEAVEKLEKRVRLAGDLEMLHAKYEEEAEVLKERLHSAERELEELKKARDGHVTEHEDIVEQLERKQEELAGVLQEKHAVEEELASLKIQLEGETKVLEDNLESLERERDELKARIDELEVRHDQAVQGRDERDEQLKNATAATDLLRLELKAEMDGRAEQATAATEALDAAKARADQAEATRDELTAQVSSLETKLAEAQAALQAASEHSDNAGHLREQIASLQKQVADSDEALRSAQEVANKTAEEHASLETEVSALRAQLGEADAAMKALQEEEQRLQTEITPLQAEVQKLLSERRFLESKVQSGTSEISALKQLLEETRASQRDWEGTAKSAEVKLDLQAAQHKKTVEDLRKDITALEASAKLVDTVADLQERNAELDAVLKAKCQEIEENDDRFIKFVKDEKRLTAKVEFLSKKVKNLQDKLSAAQDTTPKAVLLPSASQPNVAGPPQPASVPHYPSPNRGLPALPDMPDFAAAGSSRGASTSAHSSTLSPRERVPAPVFRARTPEPARSPAFSAPTQHPPPPLQEAFAMSTSTSTIGVKRRVPEDFDDCDSVPPQTFTADSVPLGAGDGVNTPRVRRALQSVRTGFTPVRHVKPAPAHAHGPGSPPRRNTTGAAIIADVTNSPRSKSGQATKRGWLGKLKSSGASSSSSSSSRGATRPVDRRPQNAGS